MALCEEDADGEWGVSGTITCPKCGGSKLHYSIYGHNGHIHGKCETPGCLDFVSSFLLTESVTVDELALVKANLDILQNRISNVGSVSLRIPASSEEYFFPPNGRSCSGCAKLNGKVCDKYGCSVCSEGDASKRIVQCIEDFGL